MHTKASTLTAVRGTSFLLQALVYRCPDQIEQTRKTYSAMLNMCLGIAYTDGDNEMAVGGEVCVDGIQHFPPPSTQPG